MSTAIQMCDVKGGYAGQECVLEPDHEGDHKDYLDRTWDAEGIFRPVPAVEADHITHEIAQRIADNNPLGRYYEEEGTVTIDGVEIAWWMDDDKLWFYNKGDSGEDTIKRFHVSRSVDVWEAA